MKFAGYEQRRMNAALKPDSSGAAHSPATSSPGAAGQRSVNQMGIRYSAQRSLQPTRLRLRLGETMAESVEERKWATGSKRRKNRQKKITNDKRP